MRESEASWVACTTAIRASLPAVRVLAASLERHHPGVALRVLVVDDLAGEAARRNEPFDVVDIGELSLSRTTFLGLATVYDADELRAAMRPWLLERVLETGASAALSFDDQAEVFAALDDVWEEVAAQGLVVVPRLDRPAVGPDGEDRETAEDTGVYETGIVGVGPSSRAFLLWWQRQVQRGHTRIHGAREPLDERYFARVPALFPAQVRRDPTLGVTAVNVSGRRLIATPTGFEIDGSPLRTFHFGRRPDEPTAATSLAPAASQLYGEREDRCRRATRPDDATEYGFGALADGTPIDTRMRLLAREALDARGEGLGPPSPFEDGDAFRAWLEEPWYPRASPRLSRYLARIWFESEGLRREYADLGPETCIRFLEWLRTTMDDSLPAALRPTDDDLDARRAELRRSRPLAARPAGVNIVGYLGAVLGVGEVGRLLVDALAANDIATAQVINPASESRVDHAVSSVRPENAPYDVNLLVVNADMTGDFATQVGPSFFAGRRTIGLWFWEVDPYDAVPAAALDLVDEIWAPSAFVRDALRGVPKPVVQVPIPVPIPVVPDGVGRAELNLPEDRFLVGFTFDYLSVAERKNPLGLLEAYTKAFAPDDGAALVLKSINGERRPAQLARLRAAAADRPDVLVIDKHFSAGEQAAFLAACDAYASLHRSEGLGLTMAQAMALGKPVIATGYSGNLEFMDDAVAYLVDHELRAVGAGAEPYPATAQWADPSVDHAASLMRRVFEHRGEADERGRRAATRIRAHHSVDAVGPRLAELAAHARERRRDAPPTWRNHFMTGWRVRPRPDLHRYYEYDWLPDGTPVDDTMQRAFEAALDGARRGKGRVAPNPDAPGGSEAVLSWLDEPWTPRLRPIVSRYLLQYWTDHADLQARFPDLGHRRDARAYLEWMRQHWRDETDIPFPLAE
ncbi:MAG: glycosyltransferase [Acidimicrobiia bacterium]